MERLCWGFRRRWLFVMSLRFGALDMELHSQYDPVPGFGFRSGPDLGLRIAAKQVLLKPQACHATFVRFPKDGSESFLDVQKRMAGKFQ